MGIARVQRLCQLPLLGMFRAKPTLSRLTSALPRRLGMIRNGGSVRRHMEGSQRDRRQELTFVLVWFEGFIRMTTPRPPALAFVGPGRQVD